MFNFLKKIDIWLNMKVFNGDEETISSRLGRHIERDECLACKIFCRVVLIPLSLVLIIIGKQKGLKHCGESVSDR